MTELTTQEVAEPTTQAPQAVAEVGTDGQVFDAKRAQDLIEKLREENKAAKASAKKLAEYEAAEQKRKEAEMSELEKLQSQIKVQQEQIRAQATREMQRASADKYHLPAELVARLVGETAEEMEADAAKLAAALPKQAVINPTNVSNGPTKATDAQWRDFMYGNGKLPGA